MPGATATTLMYSEVVDMNVAESGAVNFADSADYGHRVLVEMSKSALNSFLRWERAIGSDRPTAVLGDSTEFTNALLYALSTEFTDIDGVNNGLHYGTSNLSTNTDSRIREGGLVSMNDIALAFVLWKIYGSSTTMTKDHIYNLEDAFGMATNESVATAILQSFQTNLPVVDAMFRDLLAADPMRFFDGSGNQLTGLFETNADVSGSDSWQLVDNDILEVKLRFTFENPVTRRGVAGKEHNITYPENAAGEQENQQTIIGAGDYFYIRLQLKVADVAVPPPEVQVKTTNGLLSWLTRIFTTDLQCLFVDSVTDSSGNIYLCGNTNSTLTAKNTTFETFGTKVDTTITNTSSYTQTINNGNSQVGLVVKYSKTGTPIWHTYVSGTGGFSFNGIGIDNLNNIYTIGQSATNSAVPASSIKQYYHRNSSTGALELYGTSTSSFVEIIKIKYNSSGTIQWMSSESGIINGTLTAAQAKPFNVDTNGNNYSMLQLNANTTLTINNPVTPSSIGGTITTSSPYGTYSFGATTSSILIKRDSNGNPLWICPITGSPSQISISFDSIQNLIISCSFNSVIAGGTHTIYNAAVKVGSSFTPTIWGTNAFKSSADVFIIKYTSNGSVVWINHLYHNSTSVSSNEYGQSSCVDSNDNIYLAGTYQRNLTLCNASSTSGVAPSPYGILSQTLISGTSNPSTSFYLVKMNSNGQIVPNCMTNINTILNITLNVSQICVDPIGNIYVGIIYNANITLNNFTSDPGTTSSSIVTTGAKTITKVGNSDFVFIKYSPSFQVIYAHPIQGTSSSINGGGSNLSIDKDGKVNLVLLCINTANQLSVYDGTDLTSKITAYIPTHIQGQAILLHYD